jgi:hypothetical protein
MGLPRHVTRRLAVTFACPGVLLVAAFAPACARDAWSDGAFHKEGRTVTLGTAPPSWQRIDVDGADLAFRDSSREGSALSVLTEHLIMGTTERQFDAQDVIPFDGREAMHSLLRAKLDGVPMRYDIYVLKKDGCVYDLVYVAPPDRFPDGSSEFERFAGGLHAASSP